MYIKYFGFREMPFNLTPNSKFFYNSPFHREALASLIYGIQSKKGFMVVSGEVGTGKTTLIRKLLRGLEANHHSILIFNTLVTFDELLENIMQDLGLDYTSSNRVANIHRLNEFLLDKTSKGHTVALLIDEAQNLSDNALEAVRLLSNFETDRDKLLQIILVGQPELEAKLNSPGLRQLKQRVSLWSRLDRLSATETETYIRHRLEIAGYQGPDIFTSSAMKSIYYYTLGTPRLINSICDNALLTAFAVSKKIVSEQIIDEVVGDLRLKKGLKSPSWDLPDDSSIESSSTKGVLNPGKASAETGAADVGFGGWRSAPRNESIPEDTQEKHNAFSVAQTNAEEEKEHERRPPSNLSKVTDLRDKRKKYQERGESISAPRAAASNADAGNLNRTSMASTDEIVSAAIFAEMTKALTDAMGPMASLVVRDQIAKLSKSGQGFPAVQLQQLIAAVKQEILSDDLRRRFEEEMTNQVQKHSRFRS